MTDEELIARLRFLSQNDSPDTVPISVQTVRGAADRLETLRAENERLRGLIEGISDAWAEAVQTDLENGVRILNEAAADDFSRKYPNVAKVGEVILDAALAQGEG